MYRFPLALMTALFLSLFGRAFSVERELSLTINPGCSVECDNLTGLLGYVRADSGNDSVHHLWDLTSGTPVVLMALSPLNTTLEIDWPAFLNGASYNSVTFQPPPSYVFAFLIDKIIEFNDVNNTGQLDENRTDTGYLKTLDTRSLSWERVDTHNASDRSSLVLRAPLHQSQNNGQMQIMLSAFGSSDHSGVLPHLLHSMNSSQVDITLDRVAVTNASSRLGMRVITLSTDPHDALPSLKAYKTIDDEHSPGIFRVNEMLTNDNGTRKSGGGYLEWRSVAYTSSERSMSNSTNIHHYPIRQESSPEERVRGTLLYAMFGSDISAMAVNAFNVSIGSHGDGFYANTNYATWTLLAGLGRPVEEEFSTLILTVLVLGLGIPAVLIVVGIFCIVVRKFSKNANDIFLSQ